MSAGRVLADRYELGAMIGRGGMAEVYAATDRLLGREVAVKVLRERFRDDAAFTARFQDEARHVARLAHPNLVVVFDTGSDQTQPYIVMERIRGRTLQQAIDAGGLTQDRALEVVGNVCSALGYAHDHGLVHRDVKPGNIMLAEDGAVKVTDFGIARAMSDETITATAAVLGTAAYLSPEQAQGRRVDARSDLYSLGVVLYELLTGKVPFTGENAVAVALQHVRARPEAPRTLSPAVSRDAETIALRLLEKDPDRRYQHADDVRADLDRARRGEALLPLRTASARRATAADTTPLARTRGGDLDATTAIAAQHGDLALERTQGEPNPRIALTGDGFAPGVTGTIPPTGSRTSRVLGYVALVAVTIGVVLAAVSLLGDDGPPPEPVAMPQLIGATIPEATDLLIDAGLRLGRVQSVETTAAEPGTVVSQSPAAGTSVLPGSSVDVTIARSPDMTRVPNVAGLSAEDARRRLREADLVPGPITRASSDTLPADVVIATDPIAGSEVSIGTIIGLIISDGPAVARVLSVVNQTREEAEAILIGQGFLVDVYEEASGAIAVGRVTRQVPAAGEPAILGTKVMIWISLGPEGPGDPAPPDDPATD